MTTILLGPRANIYHLAAVAEDGSVSPLCGEKQYDEDTWIVSREPHRFVIGRLNRTPRGGSIRRLCKRCENAKLSD